MPKFTKVTDLVKPLREKEHTASKKCWCDPVQDVRNPLVWIHKRTSPAYRDATDWQSWTFVAALIAGLLALGCIALAYQNHVCEGGKPLPSIEEVVR